MWPEGPPPKSRDERQYSIDLPYSQVTILLYLLCSTEQALMADDAAHTLRRVAADVQLLHRRLLPESLAEDYAHNLEDMIDVPEPAVSPLRLQQLVRGLDPFFPFAN